MSLQDIKTRVKEAFTGVESEGFLQEQINKGIEKHRLNYREFKAINPEKDFTSWKIKNEEININSNDNSEIMAMGIFLLALDEFEKEFKKIH